MEDIKGYLKEKGTQWCMNMNPVPDLHMVFMRREDVAGAARLHSTRPPGVLEPLCHGRRSAGRCVCGQGADAPASGAVKSVQLK